MFKLKIDREPSGLEKAIDSVLSEMDGLSADSDEYAKMVTQLGKLHEMKTKEGPTRPSPDVWINNLGNLLSVLLIINFEKVHVVTSKAMTFVRRVG